MRGGRRRSRQDGDGKNVEKRTTRLAVRSSVYTIAVAHRFGEEEEADVVGWLDTCLGKLIKHLSIIFVASVMGNRNGARRKHPPLLVPHSRFASPLFSYPLFSHVCHSFFPVPVFGHWEWKWFYSHVWLEKYGGECVCIASVRGCFFCCLSGFLAGSRCSLVLSGGCGWLSGGMCMVSTCHPVSLHSLCQAPVSWKCSVACQHVLH